MTKHFPGGGRNSRLDPHFEFNGQIYPGNNFDYHLIPFEAALSQERAIMPYYGVPTTRPMKTCHVV
jgi:beta-glucosidase